MVRFGRAHCKIATLQEAMALTFHDTFVEALHKCTDEILDYHMQRKKLESRRLSYDAAMSKLEGLRKTQKWVLAVTRKVEDHCEGVIRESEEAVWRRRGLDFALHIDRNGVDEVP